MSLGARTSSVSFCHISSAYSDELIKCVLSKLAGELSQNGLLFCGNSEESTPSLIGKHPRGVSSKEQAWSMSSSWPDDRNGPGKEGR